MPARMCPWQAAQPIWSHRLLRVSRSQNFPLLSAEVPYDDEDQFVSVLKKAGLTGDDA